MLLQVNLEKANAVTPKRLNHNEVSRNLDWNLQEILPSEEPEPSHLSIPSESGNVSISFAPFSRCNSTRSFRSPEGSKQTNNSRKSVDSFLSLRLAGIRDHPVIPQPEYRVETPQSVQPITQKESPTQYEINPSFETHNQCFVITKVYIDKQKHQKEFLESKNNNKRKWFLTTFSQQEIRQYRETYYAYLEEVEDDNMVLYLV